MVDILYKTMKCMYDGYAVSFNGVLGLGTEAVHVPAPKLVLAYANEWAQNNPVKSVYFAGNVVGRAWCKFKTTEGVAPRGMAYWDVADDNGTTTFVSDVVSAMDTCR